MNDDIFADFEEDNEPLGDEWYEGIAEIERANAKVSEFLESEAGKEFKQLLSKAMGETKYERINIQVTRPIEIALRNFCSFLAESE